MNKFTIYPAIDLRRGQVVRLEYGDPNRQTTFSDDPYATAERWKAAGATWLHVVNLDGAFDEAGLANWGALQNICKAGLPVQFGGGLRDMAAIENAFDAGANRVILGTVAIENPELVAAAIAKFGGARVVVGIDARDNEVKTRGWQSGSGLTPAALGQQMAELGIQTIIHTDINRDGVGTGVNRQASAELAQAIGLPIIASGGVGSLDDILAVAALREQGLSGVIVGRALYDEHVDLATALVAVAEAGGDTDAG